MRKTLVTTLAAAALVAALAPLHAQKPFSGTIEIRDSLERLNQMGTFLMVAAHPDDERTGVLAYLARGRHMRTAYLSLTRGEGGQNLIGPEKGAELGLVRTQELLTARKIDGAEQFFTRAIDFGFTKTADETFSKWGRERTLSDIVWVIRSYRPDVMMTVFSGTPADGHGQHQVSALLGREAFEAAADPTRFPEQLKYVSVWKPRRLLGGGFGFGPSPAAGGAARDPLSPPPAGFGAGGPQPQAAASGPSMETNAFDPILGFSYEELATISRGMHHSQGIPGLRRVGGAGTSTFRVLAGDPATRDAFEGIDTTWNRLPGGAAVGTILAEALRGFDLTHPESTVPLLVKARPLIAAIDDPLARIKLVELDEAILLCSGTWVEAQALQPGFAPGAPMEVTATVVNRSRVEESLESISAEGLWKEPLTVTPTRLAYNQPVTAAYKHRIPADAAYSQPYWLVQPSDGNTYPVEDQRLIGQPGSPAPLSLRFVLHVAGTRVEVVRPVHYRYSDRDDSERVRPVVIQPAVAIEIANPVALFPTATARKISVSLRANGAAASGQVRLDMPAGWKATPAAQPFTLTAAGEQTEVTFEITPPGTEAVASLRAVATVNGRETSEGTKTISYPHIPVQTLFPSASVKLVRVPVQLSARKIGYIMGAGDEVPDSIREMGGEVTLLSKADLDKGDLSHFDAIVAGIRAYNTRADLRATQQRLLDYVRNGGTYIVQYQTADSAAAHLGPYPFTVPGGNRLRVTVEEAPVTFTDPASPLLNTPNKITQKDFEGWVQERTLYVASTWDAQYQTMLASHDPGEEDLAGGQLMARYGKGVYIFSSYAWFRQLPAGVPGAYRLFANLLSAK
jgi:LmbE family N-acetylglucosaminyl deacetylase